MDPELTFRDGPDEGVISPAEQFLLWAVRLASLPLLMLVIVLAALIYGVACLGRHAASLSPVVSRQPFGPGKMWDSPVGTHDA